MIITMAVITTTSKVISQSKDTILSEEAQAACIEYGDQYGICPELLMAIAEKESGGNPKAENGGCKGLMQVNPTWHRGRMARLGVTNIYDERENILVAADYLAELFEDCSEASYVLDVYNGNSKARYNLENGVLSPFAKWILNRSAELEELHGKRGEKRATYNNIAGLL